MIRPMRMTIRQIAGLVAAVAVVFANAPAVSHFMMWANPWFGPESAYADWCRRTVFYYGAGRPPGFETLLKGLVLLPAAITVGIESALATLVAIVLAAVVSFYVDSFFPERFRIP